jgi:hypothetical protein
MDFIRRRAWRIFAGLIAPNVFNNAYEYPILIAVSLLVLPGMFEGGWQQPCGRRSRTVGGSDRCDHQRGL